MGLFKSKKKIYVASTPYNLAGPLADRMSYLKSTVARSLLMRTTKTSLGQSIVEYQFAGPSFSQRRFFRWAQTNYTKGMLSGRISNRRNADAEIVARHIPKPPGQMVYVQAAQIDSADFVYWVERHLMRNRPERFAENWMADVNNAGLVTITYPDQTTEQFTLGSDYNRNATYLFAYYYTGSVVSGGIWNYGEWVREDGTRPDTDLYDLMATEDYSETVLLSESVIITITEDGEEPETTVTETRSETFFEGVSEVYEKTWTGLKNPEVLIVTSDITRISVKSRPRLVTDVVVNEVVSGTTTTRTETRTQRMETIWDHKTDVLEDIVLEDIDGKLDLFIYRLGSGIRALDLLRVETTPKMEFFPIIPLRLDNKSIRHSSFSADFPLYKKAYKKSIGQEIDEVLDAIEENEKIGDIDYAYLVHGVELNTKERQGLRYIYQFFKEASRSQISSWGQLDSWISTTLTSFNTITESRNAWEDEVYTETGVATGVISPPMMTRTVPNQSSILFRTPASSNLDYQVTLSWASIQEGSGSGLGKVGAKKNDLWWGSPGTAFTINDLRLSPKGAEAAGTSFDGLRLYWQYEDDAYRYLDIRGLFHDNMVYGGKSVVITGKEALEDEDESGFIIPLHYPTLQRMPVVQANELAASARLIVFNSYVVKKIRWYQRGIFRFIFMILITVIFFPAGIGLLGAHAAVGFNLLGLTGIAGLVAGVVINSIAAIVLTTLISKGAIAIFGEKLGGIIAAIVTFFTFQFVMNFHMTGSWAFNFADMLRADNLLRLTNVIGDGVEAWARGEMARLQTRYEEMSADYNDMIREIERRSMELLGSSGVYLDPLQLLEMSSNSTRHGESSATFLERTLLKGSDVAEISFVGIRDFVDLTLQLPEAIT
jgi:hypothetical protein